MLATWRINPFRTVERMAKKRVDHSSTSNEAAFDNPFGALAGLKASLPEGDSAPSEAAPAATSNATHPFSAKLVLRVERKGRGGKTVTILEGLSGDESARKKWLQELKTKLGCGAKWEDQVLVVQGDQADRIREWLQAQGAKRVVGGGR